MDTKIKVHGTFWQECILQRIEMLLAQWRTLRVYVDDVDSFLDSCEKTTEVEKMQH